MPWNIRKNILDFTHGGKKTKRTKNDIQKEEKIDEIENIKKY